MNENDRVNVMPMPEGIRSIPAKWRPTHPPIFPGGVPTRADIALALELIESLDAESRAWYASSERRLRARLADA